MVLLFGLIVVLSCEKEDIPDGNDKEPLVFTSLRAARSPIFTEDTTRITATASGYNLSYHWFVEKGDLLGTGSEITFVATPCTIGDNDIICTVKDGNNIEEIKHVTVTVL